MARQQGFGCMGITAFYGDPMPEADGVQLLKDVYAAGVRHFDTAELYRSGNPLKPDENTQYNETVLGKFVATVDRADIVVATKILPQAHGPELTEEAVTKALDASLERLGMDYVDIYYLHRLPNNRDVKVFMTAAKAAVQAGKVKNIGLSEAGAAKIREAHAIHPVSFIQQEWSLLTRELEEHIIPTCKELGITIVAYSPLARNLLTGVVTEPPKDFRASVPRYSPENLDKNIKLVADIKTLGDIKGCSTAQLSLAWIFHKAKALGVTVIPIPGTTKIAHCKDNLASEDVTLSGDEVAKLEQIAATVAGARGDESYQKMSLEGQL